MTRYLTFAVFSLFASAASAQGLSGYQGCAEGTEIGFVTVLEEDDLHWVTSGEFRITALPGDELRVCRYWEEYAIVTLWSPGYGFSIHRDRVSGWRPVPNVRDVTSEDIACIGPEIDRIQSEYGGEQEDYLLPLARRTGVSLSMLAEIRSAYWDYKLSQKDIPECREPSPAPTDENDDVVESLESYSLDLEWVSFSEEGLSISISRLGPVIFSIQFESENMGYSCQFQSQRYASGQAWIDVGNETHIFLNDFGEEQQQIGVEVFREQLMLDFSSLDRTLFCGLNGYLPTTVRLFQEKGVWHGESQQ